MPWARFADDYLGNPKLGGLSTSAVALDMAGIIYSARELRDGHLSSTDVQAIAALIHLRRWDAAAAELVAARRWVAEDGGWLIHDYLDYQPSREKVMAERTAARDRRRVRSPNSGERSGYANANSGRTQSTPYPVPVPVPEFPNGNPGLPPNPPRSAKGARSSRRRTNGLNFDEDGPRFEQRTNAEGKREWVPVGAEVESEP
jgi:hypothetical protein